MEQVCCLWVVFGRSKPSFVGGGRLISYVLGSILALPACIQVLSIQKEIDRIRGGRDEVYQQLQEIQSKQNAEKGEIDKVREVCVCVCVTEYLSSEF